MLEAGLCDPSAIYGLSFYIPFMVPSDGGAGDLAG